MANELNFELDKKCKKKIMSMLLFDLEAPTSPLSKHRSPDRPATCRFPDLDCSATSADLNDTHIIHSHDEFITQGLLIGRPFDRRRLFRTACVYN